MGWQRHQSPGQLPRARDASSRLSRRSPNPGRSASDRGYDRHTPSLRLSAGGRRNDILPHEQRAAGGSRLRCRRRHISAERRHPADGVEQPSGMGAAHGGLGRRERLGLGQVRRGRTRTCGRAGGVDGRRFRPARETAAMTARRTTRDGRAAIGPAGPRRRRRAPAGAPSPSSANPGAAVGIVTSSAPPRPRSRLSRARSSARRTPDARPRDARRRGRPPPAPRPRSAPRRGGAAAQRLEIHRHPVQVHDHDRACASGERAARASRGPAPAYAGPRRRAANARPRHPRRWRCRSSRMPAARPGPGRSRAASGSASASAEVPLSVSSSARGAYSARERARSPAPARRARRRRVAARTPAAERRERTAANGRGLRAQRHRPLTG